MLRRSDSPSSLLKIALFGGGAVLLGLLALLAPSDLLFGEAPSVQPELANTLRSNAESFGMSGEVRLQLRMPREQWEFGLEATSRDSIHALDWVRAEDTLRSVPAEATVSTTVTAPSRPGFYRLAITRKDGTRFVDSVIVGVLVPFATKKRSALNGYTIGTYSWERSPGDATPPPIGFIEVRPEVEDLPISAHFRISDFITRDGQQSWPRYVALDTRILDKVELVLRYLGSREHDMTVAVHSGFRTPYHNRRVPRAASDSRHQYGDAADLAIDVDEDGRISYLDVLAVSRVVEMVERDYPALVGGLGLYGNQGTAPYVHIDVRGARKRWRG
jgi:uncharacterized protein YcbK (DUF882 family)